MKGYIKIEANTQEGAEGMRVNTELYDVSNVDRIIVVSGVCDALHITPVELKLMADLIEAGLMEVLVDVNKLQDGSVEPQKTKKKKPDDGIAELLKMFLD